MNPLPSALLLALSLSAAGPAVAQGFLDDGGGISSERIVRTPFGSVAIPSQRIGDDRGFLDDGGSIRTEPTIRLAPAHRGRRFVNEGRSITRLRDDPSFDDGEISSRTSGSGGNVSVIYIGTPPAPEPRLSEVMLGDGMSDGAKIVDVASDRLDHRPYGSTGIDVVYSGTAKIIRIAPGYRRDASLEKDEVFLPKPEGATEFAALSPREQAVTVYPDPDVPTDKPMDAAPIPSSEPDLAIVPVPSPAPEEGRRATLTPAAPTASAPAAPPAPAPSATGFEPWTAEWLRDCVARYPDFDASLGTYLDESGRRRFCTGEP